MSLQKRSHTVRVRHQDFPEALGPRVTGPGGKSGCLRSFLWVAWILLMSWKHLHYI